MIWLVGFGAALVGWAVFAYNRLVSLHRRADGAWADIDAQLKRRYDLVPALVETVKGYAAHERQTLEEVVARRTAAGTQPRRPESDTVAREAGLAGALRGLFALAEDYPELRASERFGALQVELAEVEDDLQSARRYYNAVVRVLNTRSAQVPDVAVARLGGFVGRDFFELESAMERQAVRVDLDD